MRTCVTFRKRSPAFSSNEAGIRWSPPGHRPGRQRVGTLGEARSRPRPRGADRHRRDRRPRRRRRYEIGANGLALLLDVNVYFTLFFLVAFAVFVSRALLKTRLVAFSRDLDARFGLKERLGAAAAYRASRSIPADIVEAQARESAEAIDFASLRRSFRFRPYGPLLALSLGTALTAWLVWRYPEQIQPRNLVFHGARW